MTHRRGWGLLLAVALVLLLGFAWSQLQSRKSSVNLERFGEWMQTDSAQLMRPLLDFGVRNRQAARRPDGCCVACSSQRQWRQGLVPGQ